MNGETVSSHLDHEISLTKLRNMKLQIKPQLFKSLGQLPFIYAYSIALKFSGPQWLIIIIIIINIFSFK